MNADTNFEPISGHFRLWSDSAKPKGSSYPIAAQTMVIAHATTKLSRHYNQYLFLVSVCFYFKVADTKPI